MNANLRDALKTLKQAQAARDANDYAKARDLCEQSIALFSTPEAKKLRETINVLDNQPHEARAQPSAPVEAGSASASDSGDDVILSAQKDTVQRVLRCKGGSYYDVMGLKKDATVVEIKIAYRKLAIQLNPTHNKAPGAGEAFSLVSAAFQVLSDEEKRAAYDKRDKSSGGGVSLADLEGEMTPTELFEKECARVWESTRILETHLSSREEMLEYTQWYYSALVDLGYPNDCESNPISGSSLEEIEGSVIPNDVRQQLLSILQWPFDIYEVLALKLKASGMSILLTASDFSDLVKACICAVLAPAIVAILQEITALAVWLEKEWVGKDELDQNTANADDCVAAKDHFGLLKSYTFVKIEELFVTNLFETISTSWNRRKKGKDVLDEILKDTNDGDFQTARDNIKMALMKGTEIVFNFMREYVRVQNQEVAARKTQSSFRSSIW